MKKDIPLVSFKKEQSDKLDFEIYPIQDLFKKNDTLLDHSITQPHRVNFPIIIFITKGTGQHFIDFKSYTYKKGSIIFIAKEQIQSFEIKSTTKGFIILFTEKFIWKTVDFSNSLNYSKLFNYHSNEPILHLKKIDLEDFSNIIFNIYAEYNQSNIFAKEEILRTLLNWLLLKSERILRKNTDPKRVKFLEKPFNEFRNLLVKTYQNTRNAKDYAQEMNISYKHLNDICKSILGKTAKEFIDNYLILETKRHLASSNISIKELTFKMGFDEPTNFIKFFKKHTQQTPSQFKKLYQK